MTVLEAIILGIVQGLSEFLPISSSGHLKLFEIMFGMKEPIAAFDIALHLGTLVPICVIYRNDLIDLLKKPFQKLTILLIVATIPATLVTFLFGDFIESMSGNTAMLPFFFAFTGVLLLLSDGQEKCYKQVDEMSVLDAFLIGCMQAVAIMPGISRSGSTITTSIFRKLNRSFAAKFSFLMFVPAILGATLIEAKKILVDGVILPDIPLGAYILGSIASMFVGYLVVTYMIKIIQKRSLKFFAIYVFIVAIVSFFTLR